MGKRAAQALLSAALALGLALAPMPAYANADAPEVAAEETLLTYQPRDDYLRDGLDESITEAVAPNPVLASLAALIGWDMTSFADSGHTLYLKNTLFDAAAAQGDRTLDAIYAREDWMSIIAGQYGSTADLLDPGDGSPYYVALAAPAVQNGLGAPTDHAFAAMTNDGDVVDGALYDAATGLAYLPKDLYRQDGKEVPFGCQLQLLMPTDLASTPTCLTDVTVDCADDRVDATGQRTIESSAYDVTTTLPVATPETAGHLTLSDIHVRLNGSADELALIEGETASWDPSTGMLEIAASPQTLLRADVSCDGPGLLELFAEPANAMPTSALSYVPEVVFDSLNLDTLTPGRAIPFDSYVNYWWPNHAPDDQHWQSCVATGSYCYSWINDPTALYEYIAWADGADWNGVSSQDVSNFFVDPDQSQASRHYFNYVFELGNYTFEDQCFHSERWPVTSPHNYGSDWATFGLQCSHSKNPVGDGVSTDDAAGRMVMRILDVNTEAERPYVVIGFVGPSIADQPGVGIYKFEIRLFGDIELAKASDLPEASARNPNYRMAGITYDVFADAACTSPVCSVVLDERGCGTSDKLRSGTYYVRESASSLLSSGYALDATVHPVTVRTGETSHLDVSDTPQTYAAGILIRKRDSVTGCATPQGNGSLAGAIFEVRHYRESFSSAGDASGLTPSRTWRFATDAEGCIKLDEGHLVGGDALFRTKDGSPCLPLGTLAIREASPPVGYRADGTTRIIALRASGTTESIAFTQVSAVPEEIVRGGVLIEKRDAESGLSEPLGGASLVGTLFEIRNASTRAVCVDGIMRQPGELVRTIASAGGVASTEPDALPFGAYELKETAAGSGYLMSDVRVRSFKIERDGELVRLDGNDACYDQVKRGDIDFRKVLQTDQSRLARIPFILESATTGERHVLVTDDNGIVNTAAGWRSHASNTNGNDGILDEERDPSDPIDADLLDPEVGTWFGLGSDGRMTPPNDGLGALPYDTYVLTELRATTNEGLDLIRIANIKITAHGTLVPLGDIEDRMTPPAAISTSARNAEDASKQLHPNRDARVIDRIDYCGLATGAKYAFTGRLMDAETGEAVTDAQGEPIVSTLQLTPAASSGNCEVAFEFDAFPYRGKRLVCFETLTRIDTGEAIATHEDLDDHGQSVEVLEPAINTYATDSATDAKAIIADGLVTIVDAVSYSGLEEGAEYLLQGQLMQKTPEGADPVNDEDGEPLACAVAFTPLSRTGSTEVLFTLDPTSFPEGAEFVVYETLTRDGRDLVVHENPDNDAQTVTLNVPHIATHAFAKTSGLDAMPAQDGLTITDEVLYEGLVAGKAYALFGTVMMAREGGDGQMRVTPLLDSAGIEVTATTQFTPQAASGSAFLDIPLDARELGGARLVIYEQLISGGTVIAAHEDPNAESQTIWIEDVTAPSIPEPSPDIPEPQTRTLTVLPQTGDGAPWLPALLIALLSGALSAWLIWSARHDKASKTLRRPSTERGSR